MKSPRVVASRVHSARILIGTALTAFLVLMFLFRLHTVPAQAARQSQDPEAVQRPAGTIVNGNIITNTTWTLAGSPYTLTKLINVAAGVSLTVEPGVNVIAAQFSGLTVYGNLIARGDPGSPVLFTAATKTPGSWLGIEVYGSAGVTPTIRLENATVEYGGNSLDANVTVQVASASIDQSTFRFSGGYGFLADLDSQLQIANSIFLSNTRSAVQFTGDYSAPYDPVLSNLSASGNGLNVVEYYSADLQGNHTWEFTGLPYFAKGGLQVTEGARLTVDPGVQVQVDTGFYVYGDFQAVGTPANPITFTGKLTEASVVPNTWWGMTIGQYATLTPTAELRYVTIEYGGWPSPAGANLSMGTAHITLTNSTIRNGPGNGVVVADVQDLVVISDTQFNGNGRYPLFLAGASDPVLRNLGASGNLTNAIGVGGPWFAFEGDYVWEEAGLPYVAEGNPWVDADATLTIEPGVEVRMVNGDMSVYGSLTAVGTVTRPITVTGISAVPGAWGSIYVSGQATLDYCDIGFGGAPGGLGPTPMLTFGGKALVQRCRIHDSLGAGIQIIGNLDVRPFIRQNRIENNSSGLSNDISGAEPQTIDARYNWWGDPTGPFHPTTNPGGTGNAVSDRVLFSPWLTSSQQIAVGLTVDLVGPTKFVPGGIEEYAIRFINNNLSQTIENAVVVFALPKYAAYEDDSGGGILWPQPRQLFWKLGNLAPGQTGLLSVRVRFDWGIPYGVNDTAAAFISGSNLASPPFDVSGYLAYVPRTVVNEEPLTASDVTAERSAYPELNQLYQQAIASGYQFGAAARFTLNGGAQVTRTVLLKFQPDFSAVNLSRSGTRAYAIVMGSDSFVIQTVAGAVSYDSQTGGWQTVTPPLAALSPDRPAISWGDCMQNCIIDLVPATAAGYAFKSVSVVKKGINCVKAAGGDELSMPKCANIITKIPGISEGIDLGKCNSDCQEDPDSHWCTEDKYYCNGGWFYEFMGFDTITRVKCATEVHRYLAPVTETICTFCQKCVEDSNGPHCTAKSGASLLRLTLGAQAVGPAGSLSVAGSAAEQCSECVAAKDPNAKYGPEGDLVPGQLVTYTIEYENVGSGDAYGVFVEDPLSEAFDLSTLTLYGGGNLVAANRTVYWFVDHLAPKGQAGSTGTVTLTVRLKSNLPSGTVIANQAVVHFPSVPEDTPTNPVVNVVRPLVALPQTVQATAGITIPILLQGRDAAGSPLVYNVVEQPLYGTLSGTAPNLSYRADPNAARLDRLRFTVSNAVTSSLPAEVGITILPSPLDVTPPQVVRTVPTNGAALPPLDATPFFTDAIGPVYRPIVVAEFSEAISVTTLTTATVRLTRPGGEPVQIVLGYDAATERLQIMPRERLNQGILYTVTISAGVKDLRGNGLGANYSWSFTVGSGQKLYLPAIRR